MPSLTRYLIVIAALTAAMLYAALHERNQAQPDPASHDTAAPAHKHSPAPSAPAQAEATTTGIATVVASPKPSTRPTAEQEAKPVPGTTTTASLAPERPDDQDRADRQPSAPGAREQQLDDALARQALDAPWALAMEDSLRQTLEGASQDYLQIGAITCRTTFCRIEVDHDSEAAQAGFIANLARRPDFVPDGESRHLHQETTVDGKLRLRFYLAREGAALPLRS
ncbi:MAG: hypothetical protein AAGI15_05120 [Pseudomonadota bacterium]